MKEERKRLLAKVAYLYYCEGKSQAEIAEATGIYRTSISRMLEKARDDGIVSIQITGFDTSLFELEESFKKRFNLASVVLVQESHKETNEEHFRNVASAAASHLRQLISAGDTIGLSWGSTLSEVVNQFETKAVKDVSIYPLSGGPSHLHRDHQVNSLVYRLAHNLHGKGHYIRQTAIQEQDSLPISSFGEIASAWEILDIAIIGIGAKADKPVNSQWRDLLSQSDIIGLRKAGAVGEICCRFYDDKGQPVNSALQERTIGIPLDTLKKVPKRMAVAIGLEKAAAILAAVKAGYCNHLVTDKKTMEQMLLLDKN